MRQCPKCKSGQISDTLINSVVPQYKCENCGFIFPAENTDHSKPDAMKFILRHQEEIKGYIKQTEIEKYKGDKVFCPVCQSGFGSFAPVYAWAKSGNLDDLKCITQNENARCPNCNSLERHRLLWKYLHDRTGIFDNNQKRLLEFAPDEFFFNAFKNKEQIEYFPCDLDPAKQKFANYEGAILKEDITNLSFAGNSFDFILCSHVLEHVADDELAMSELFRVLKIDGIAIIQVPVDYTREKTYEDFIITTEEGRQKAFGQKDHVRWYGKDFKERLEKAGFVITEDKFVLSFSQSDIARYGFDKYEIIYRCEKQS
jgi:SAM-dependent methyltransferase